jgi:hypothetical protein
MKSLHKRKIISELVWLLAIILISAAVEYTVIMFFDLHPVLSVKIQGFIGLIIVAYIIRMITRMGQEGLLTFDDKDDRVDE